MKHVVVVTPRDAMCGFALAGVRQQVAAPDELTGTLDRLIGDPQIGAVIVDERLLDAGFQDRVRDLDRRWTGIIVVLPGPTKVATEAEDYVLRLIRRAIGYQVRLTG